MAIQIEFVSAAALAGKSSNEKIKLILASVKQDKIVVLEQALSPAEEKELITQTMGSVSKRFPGIEISSLSEAPARDLRSMLLTLLGGKSGLTVVGPSNLVKQIKRDPGKLRLLASE
ncbi:MAG: DUF2073 domain-containing protein [Candidatus Norongarragalinales archaeon]